ncbi:MAG: DUF58 domain-containing protein [Bacteroidota bacterium]|jgi:uncharacterized protein (DUF58 family)|nr:DUF58 domain-containing protein [Bacteroidota bacterium]
MDTKQILRNVRQIEIRTRGLVNQLFSGEYHSVFKGRGMEFSEVREYQFGDDVRTIDWNVSARFNRPFVKVFEEERELTVMLLVDMSGSQDYGTSPRFKRDIAAELCAVLAFSAIKNNDKVGMIIFTDRIEKFIPPKKGRSHILRIIRDIITFVPEGHDTDIRAGLEYFHRVTKKRSIAFLISDFLNDGYDNPLKIAARKHDLIAIELYDPRERVLPDVGLIKLRDAETGDERWIDSARRAVREAYSRHWDARQAERARRFLIANVDRIAVDVQKGYIQPLVEFFRMRERRL